ncbi:glucose PTS transporter transcription antiterminator GlcT [Radiobacillus sp. PE A8.2]|uniref:glucose PTS transporter transcription antiterminator GlcT n=1 Tax=Radiobacillus sp. PE A8.2 TaxID=3380349 RepID=UPI00388DBA55
MSEMIKVIKALNNNVVIAEHPLHQEVVLIGKGIGFQVKKNDFITLDKADKTFILKDENEKEQYVNLLSHVDNDTIEFMQDILVFIEESMGQKLNEHIHIALTDHINFAIHRMQQDMQFSNPFLMEIESLYPNEYKVAKQVVDKVQQKMGIIFPTGEIGFIALHIHSAITDKSISDLNRHHQLISKLVQIIEENLDIEMEKNRIDYHRLIQHLYRAIVRAHHGEKLGEQKSLAEMLKLTYPICYNLAWKLIKVMQKQLNKPVDESEALYLTIHLQRLTNKI